MVSSPAVAHNRGMTQIAVRCHPYAPVSTEELHKWLTEEVGRLRADAPQASIRLLRLSQPGPEGEIEVGWQIELGVGLSKPPLNLAFSPRCSKSRNPCRLGRRLRRWSDDRSPTADRPDWKWSFAPSRRGAWISYEGRRNWSRFVPGQRSPFRLDLGTQERQGRGSRQGTDCGVTVRWVRIEMP
jgi:hypothetical protein